MSLQNYIKIVRETLFGESNEVLFEMANLPPRRTGLSCVVWISPRVGSHSARVKVSAGPRARPREMVSVSIEDPIRVVGGQWTLGTTEFANLQRWIVLNRDVLLKFWTGQIEYTEDATALLRKI